MFGGVVVFVHGSVGQCVLSVSVFLWVFSECSLLGCCLWMCSMDVLCECLTDKSWFINGI